MKPLLRFPLLVATLAALLGSACAPKSPVSSDELATAESGCWVRLATTQSDPARIDELLERESTAMQRLLEEGLALRVRTLRLAQTIRARTDDAPLSGAELDALHSNLRAGLDLSRRMRTAAAARSCWADAEAEAVRSRGLAAIDDGQRLAGAMLELAATLFLYDTYVLAIAVLSEDPQVRHALNERDPTFRVEGNRLEAIDDEYLSVSQRTRARELIRFREVDPVLLAKVRARGRAAHYIDQLIEESVSYAVLRDPSLSEAVDARFERLQDRSSDDLSLLSESAVGTVSRIFGNSVGLVQTRHGKLYDRPDVEETVAVELRAGDILLEKTPFRLTDKLIPGHWGHVAIWVGDEAELRELGIWAHPRVRPYHEEIRDGRRVVEALRDGVQLNTLGHFLDIDDLGVLRSNALSREDLAATIVRAIEQVGKEYDFNFDVESQDEIVCSELVYASFTNYTWPTDRQLGRYTISPDNVANLALGDGPFDLVLLYHDGERVRERTVERMASWMDAAPAAQSDEGVAGSEEMR